MPGIQKTIDTLRDEHNPITAEAIRSLSDISNAELLILASQWQTIPPDRRLTLVTRLGEIAETNFDLNFSAVTRYALADKDDDIRREAVAALWYDEEPSLLRLLIELALYDPSDAVRAEILTAIGRFILLGEHGKITPALAKTAQDEAIRIYNDVDEPFDVRRRALEAIGNCTREGVSDLIQEAYDADDVKMRASAIHAMGSSADSEWADTVLEELRSDEPEIRYEAARATGELQLDEAIPTLSFLINDEDREISEMAIWALGEIGGNSARHLLENALEQADIAGDTELFEAIEEALETASLVGEDMLFD